MSAGRRRSMSRRQVLAGTAASATALAAGVYRPAIAQSEPIRIGYLPALTGPSSSTGIGMNRGTELAVKEINAAGGINGRQIELIVRDTQSDPTKAVNAATELTRRHKVHMIWGPLNSGESLAATPLIARDGIPQVHPCWVDSLTDTKKYPLAFRNAPTNQQIGGAANHYVVNIVKAKKVAVVSDTTGYGTASLDAYVPMLKTMGAEVVYQGSVEANNPDVKPEMLRMQAAGAQAVMPWSVNAGFLSRLINTRAEMNWDVPIVGQTTLGSGQTQALLKKPEYWEKVYPNNFRNCSYSSSGALPPRTVEFVDKLRKEGISMSDTLLWWIAVGYDGPRMMADAFKAVGTKPEDVAGFLNKLTGWPGIYGTISFTPEQHDGFQTSEVIMCQANSLKDGAFTLAPGYAT
jgi:branched-chain amino acid transport system substrate-binding protein